MIYFKKLYGWQLPSVYHDAVKILVQSLSVTDGYNGLIYSLFMKNFGKLLPFKIELTLFSTFEI